MKNYHYEYNWKEIRTCIHNILVFFNVHDTQLGFIMCNKKNFFFGWGILSHKILCNTCNITGKSFYWINKKNHWKTQSFTYICIKLLKKIHRFIQKKTHNTCGYVDFEESQVRINHNQVPLLGQPHSQGSPTGRLIVKPSC